MSAALDTTTDSAGVPALLETRALVPQQVFAPGGVMALLARLEAEVRAVKTDISTAIGREQVRSLAYKVTRSKTALDSMGKALTDDARSKIDSVNAERRTIRERLDALAEEVRRPLTEYEASEKARVAGHEAALAAIADLAVYDFSTTSVEIAARLATAQAGDNRDWREFSQRAADTRATAIAYLTSDLARAQKAEAERAELARLRAEEAERVRIQQALDLARQQAERETRIAAEAAERAKREAEERAAHAARVAAEQAEAERRTAERQRREAEERAARVEAEAAEAARRAEAARVAAEQKAERDRVAAVEAERIRVAEAAEAVRQAEAARAADRAHRGRVNKAAVEALLTTGITEAQARLVVTAIVSGSVPNVSIRY